MLVAGTAAGLVLLVQSPASGVVVATAGALLLALGVPAVAAWVRRRPEGFLPRRVVREPVVVRSALAASAVPAAWFALLIAVPAVLAARGLDAAAGGPGAGARARSPASSPPGWPGRCSRASGRPGRWSPPTRRPRVALGVAALGAARGSAAILVTAVVLVTLAFGLGQPALMAAVGDAVPADVRGVALGIATLVFLVGGGVGSAVVGGVGEALGVDRSLLLLALLPLLGSLALVSTIRAARGHAPEPPAGPIPARTRTD